MKKTTLRLLSVLCALALLAGLVPGAVAAVPMGGAEVAETASAVEAAVPAGDSKAADAPAKLSAGEHTVWFVGDSTVCNYAKEGRYVPRAGYGQVFNGYLDAAYTVKNQAVGGRSSQNFVTDKDSGPLYEEMKNNIKAGDYLIIGFGHNDEKTGEDRGTLPALDWENTDDSMGYYLNEHYIKVAKEVGATPVLCTPIVRRTTGSYTGSSVHVTEDGDYPAAIKKVGADTNTPVIDLTTLTKEEWSAQTKDKNQYLHSWESSAAVDNTHLNAHGAKMVAWLLADAIKGSNDPQLADLAAALTPGEQPATISAATDPLWTAMINNDVPPLPEGYQPCPNGEGKGEENKFKDYKPANSDVSFYGSMFGALGSADLQYYPTTVTDSSIRMGVTANKGGKLGSVDGFFVYYFPVPASASSYSLSAKATVNVVPADTQSAFGLMIRDDMYINFKNSDPGIKSGYVAAGTLGAWTANCFGKNSKGEMQKGGSLSKTYQQGDTIALSVSSGGENFVAQFGDETPQTFDNGYSMKVVDSEYVYLCLFVVRTADVTFSDIVLTVDGEVLCDTRPEVGELTFAVDDWTVENGVLDSITTTKSGISTDAMGLAVVYSDGQMTGIKSVRIKPGKIPVGLELKDGDTAKVFVLSKTKSAPLFENFVYPVPNPPAP